MKKIKGTSKMTSLFLNVPRVGGDYEEGYYKTLDLSE
jgi:hypothetical protein